MFNKYKSLKKPYQILVILLIFLVPLTAYGSWYYFQVTRPANLFEPGTIAEDDEYEWDAESYFNRNIVNIALLGFDGSEARDERYTVYRTDTIKVVSVNFDEDTINIIDIPRDIYTKIADTSTYDKINHSFYFGWQYGGGSTGEERHQRGIEYTLKSISNVLGGVPLNYYAAVDMDAVETLVDSLGGVYFDMPFDLYTTRGRLVAEKGEQLLDGDQYLWYLRTREVGGDIGRVQRQTELLKATLTHIRSEGLVQNIPVLYTSYQEMIDSNLSNQQIIGLAMYAMDYQSDDIQSHTIRGRGQFKDGIYYMVMDQELRAEIIKKVFGIDFQLQPSQTLADTTPASPHSFAAQVQNNGGAHSIRLTWQPGDNNNRHFNLYRSTNGGEEVRISSEQSGRTYIDTSVQPGNSYRYRVEAVNYRAVSSSVSVSATIQGAPSQPPSDKDDDDKDEPTTPPQDKDDQDPGEGNGDDDNGQEPPDGDDQQGGGDQDDDPGEEPPKDPADGEEGSG